LVRRIFSPADCATRRCASSAAGTSTPMAARNAPGCCAPPASPVSRSNATRSACSGA
jgi:hypothetical protein